MTRLREIQESFSYEQYRFNVLTRRFDALFSPDGEQLELIQPDAGSSESPMAGFVSNLAIGGPNNDQLMVSVGNQLVIYDIK